jgi:hypothetical protein
MLAKRLISHFEDLALYRRGVQITSGNALAARLAKTAFDLQIPLPTGTAASRLMFDGAIVGGAVLFHNPVRRRRMDGIRRCR